MELEGVGGVLRLTQRLQRSSTKVWPRTGLRFAAQLDLSFSWLLTFFVAQQILSHQFPRQDRTRQVVAGVGWGGRQRQWGPNTILPEGEPDCRLPELDEKQLEGFKKKETLCFYAKIRAIKHKSTLAVRIIKTASLVLSGI